MATTANSIQEIYIGLLGRAADQGGLAYWTDQIDTGVLTLEQLRANIVNEQPEYAAGLATLSRAQTVNELYNRLFERAADDEGLEYWVNGGGATVNVDQLVLALSAGAAASDRLVLDNKVDAATYYTANTTDADYSADAAKAAVDTVDSTQASVDASKANLDSGSETSSGQMYHLTTGQDILTGTGGNDTFYARGNSSLDNADIIDGGAGTDTVEVMLDNNETAESPLFSNIEILKVQGQARTTDSGDNDVDNIAPADDVEANIDAGDMGSAASGTGVHGTGGVREYWSEDSRSDVTIEDVSRDSHITTVGMRETDPGDVDLNVFFDPENITAKGQALTGSTLQIDIANVFNIANDANPIEGFTSLAFAVDGETVSVSFAGLDSYAGLVSAIEAALDAAGISGVNVEAQALTNTFFSSNVEAFTAGTLAGQYTPILLTSSTAVLVEGNIALDADQGSGNMVFDQSNVVSAPVPALTSVEVILDRVGKDSTGGDLLIGSDSTGASGSAGIQQFNIDVDRDSTLTSISSTNNSLEVVNVENIADNSDGTGDLTVMALGDVRVFDASTMAGNVALTATLSDAVTGKYLELQDDAADPAADNSQTQAYRDVVDTEFSYDLGAGNDSLNLSIGNGNLAASGTGSREDFVLEINAGSGNDTVTTNITGASAGTDADNWYKNQVENNALTVNTGAGNDTVTSTGQGNWTINTGADSDTVYANNDGVAAGAASAEVQTLIFGAAGDLNTQGQVTVTLSNGQSFTTVGLVTADTNVTVATAVVAALGAAGAAAAGAAAAAAAATAGLQAAANAAVGTAGAAAANAALATNLALVTSTAQIAADYAAITVAQSGNQVALTYGAAYSGPADVALATISDIATDSTYTVGAAANGAGTASTFVAGTNEVITITTTLDAAAGDTLTFNDGTAVLTLVDTDGNGSVSPFEITQQLAATTFTLFDVTASNPSLGTVQLTAKNPLAPSGLTVVDSGASNATPAVTTAGVAPVAETGTGGSTLAFTVDSGADRTGSVTLLLDTDLDGVGETYTIPVSAGNESDVAVEVAAFINALPGMTAVAADAAGTSTVTMTFAAVGNAVAHTVAPVFTDGAIVSQSVVETVKGLAASTNAATWVINADNTVVANLDSGGDATNAILYKAQLTVTFSGAQLLGASGLTADAAAALSNGFESTVTIPTTGYVASEAEVNQAIKAAINNDAILSKLLVANDGPANTLVITSLVDGVFNADDLAIDIAAADYAAMNASEVAGLQAAWTNLNNDSSLTFVAGDLAAQVAIIEAAITGVNGSVQGTIAGGALMQGGQSVTVSDNVIDLGAGTDDLAVLGTDLFSNDTVVLTGSFGHDTVFNFTQTHATAADVLDVTAYLGNLETLPAGSTSTTSQTTVPTTAALATGADAVDAGDVFVVNNFVGTATETWAGLTGSALFAAINSTTNVAAANDYASFGAADFTVSDSNGNLVGTALKTVFMVENDLNDGEYKVFEVTSTGGTTDEFASVTLVGTIDLGNTLTDVSVFA